jgi:hypothetical protein
MPTLDGTDLTSAGAVPAGLDAPESQPQLRDLVSRARARYRRCPSHYLRGVIAALVWLEGESLTTPVTLATAAPERRSLAEEYEAAQARVWENLHLSWREYCLGVTTTLAWSLGHTNTPPLR